MSLIITNEPAPADNAAGGTELMRKELFGRVDNELLNKFQIICSRVRTLEDKPRILWLHDTHDDPEFQHLKDKENWKRFIKFVFVSYYQMHSFMMNFGLPYEKCIVMKNAIVPIPTHTKPEDRINLIYHTTPHRGLNILIPVFIELAMTRPHIYLDVYSSFKAYGWTDRDIPYEPIFQMCRDHPQITYHGFQPNSVVRQALEKAHIFAYPCVWPETSCIAAIEAMSAGCFILYPNFAALPETLAGFCMSYPMTENIQDHADIFYNHMVNVLDQKLHIRLRENSMAQTYADIFYNWEQRVVEWNQLLNALTN